MWCGKNRRKPCDFRLTGEQTESFSKWKSSLFKRCDVQSVFFGKEEGVLGIDAKLLKEKLGGQFYLETKNFVFLLGEPKAYFGAYSSSWAGMGNMISNQEFTAKRGDFTCSLSMRGQEDYEVSLLSGVAILGAYKKDENELSLKFKNQPFLRNSSVSVFPFLENFPLTQSISKFLELDEAKEKELADYFSLTKEQSKGFFSLSKNWSNLKHSMTFPNIPGLSPFGLDQGQLEGYTANLEKLFPLLKDEPFELVFDGGLSSSWEDLEVSFEKKLKLDFLVSSSPLEGGSQSYTLSLKNKELIDPDNSKSAAFFLKRYHDLAAFRFRMRDQSKFWHSYDESYCSVYAGDWLEVLDENLEVSEVLENLFFDWGGLEKPYPYTYGWKGLLTNLIKKHEAQGDFDSWPLHQNFEIVQEVKKNMMALEKEEIFLNEELKKAFGQIKLTGISWGFDGFYPDELRLKKIFSSLNNISEILPKVAENLWGKIIMSPFDWDDELDFVKSLSLEYKNILKLLEESSERVFVSGWYSSMIEKVLREKYSIETLKEWLETLGEGEIFIAESNRFDEKVHFLDEDIKSLMGHALKEGWTKRDFALARKFSQLGKDKIGCTISKYNRIALISCVGFDKISKKSSGLLDPKTSKRFVILADFIESWMKKLDDFEFSRIRRVLIDKFFDALWRDLSDDSFKKSKDHLDFLLKKLLEADWSDRFEVEREIENTLN